jgi:3-hydroxy acid dehydrogenase/malonic semialdehyde reductase
MRDVKLGGEESLVVVAPGQSSQDSLQLLDCYASKICMIITYCNYTSHSRMNLQLTPTKCLNFLRTVLTHSRPIPFFPIATSITKRTMTTVMGKRLAGKTILITGASSGIGRSTAMEFARTSPKNLKLILTARRLDTLKQIAEDIKKEVGDGVDVLPYKLDISKPEEIRNFVPSLPDEFKEIDILVNNAGLVKGIARAPDIAEEDINVMWATNVTGLINMTQAILPIFKKRSNGQGDIINIGSIAGRDGYPGGSIYCATKAAVRTFTDALRKELIATRIRVIEIDPGQVHTEFSLVRFYGDKAKADAVYAGCEPLTPDDIAEVIVFAAGRRENVVIADALIFPNHQVSVILLFTHEILTKFEGLCDSVPPKGPVNF